MGRPRKYPTADDASQINLIRSKEYYEQHKDQKLEYHKEYYDKNKAKILEKRKQKRKEAREARQAQLIQQTTYLQQLHQQMYTRDAIWLQQFQPVQPQVFEIYIPPPVSPESRVK